ncbi:PREDICTED: myeloid differentiation primary response protein MyD88 [Ceratosolen solmsi marchali]|uniref:Myeloid differentiation primary response protein MyD88 n=1 Tax=Ceratosolen solmsi marchali TaxID=326594 RepID=A0AAJ6YWM3_9HYME|nr:PREDICTED: myeloid differentiation primary response protein MyD88 [Ceratosolen solmsi marchali]
MSKLSRVPLIAISSETTHLISILLNPPKVIPSSNGLLRDWRGFAQVCAVGGEILPAIAADSDPTYRILSIVQKRSQDFTLQHLKDALEHIERWDIVDDSQPYLDKDANLYLERLQKSESTAEENNFIIDSEILTLDDQFRIERGQKKQHYDAFLLYADEDIDFVNEVVENLERKNNLKLCLKERDLIAGVTFEHEAIMRLISERCNRLITILSPDFLKSPANKFFLNFAQATGIDKRQERKIIPCIYKSCELPPQLTYFSKIYYKKFSSEFFWDKLIRSMKTVIDVSKIESPVEIVHEISALKDVNSNGLTLNESNEDDNTKENSSERTSKLIKSNYPTISKAKSNQVSSQGEVPTTSESVPPLPSLDKLDSLENFESCTNTTKQNSKKKKFMSKYVKKVQSLLPKS